MAKPRKTKPGKAKSTCDNGITRRQYENGTISWGYAIFLPRDSATGKQRVISKSGFAKEGEAKEARERALELLKSGSPEEQVSAARDLTLSAFFEQWIEQEIRLGRKCQPKTIERYKELAGYMLRKIGATPLNQVGTMAIRIALNELQEHGGRKTEEHPDGKPLAPKTVREIAFILHNCMETAIEWGLITKSPMDALKKKLPKVPKSDPQVLDRDRVDSLFQFAAGTRLYPMLVLATATGLRRGELLALQWSDINFTTGLLNVTKSLEETRAGLRIKTTKSGKPRRFIVPREALRVLEEHREEQAEHRSMFGSEYEDGDLIFCKPHGAFLRPDAISSRVTELMRRAGLDGTKLHSLRHSHASELLSKGIPLAAVAKRLGHAGAHVTLSIYAHALEADEVAAAEVWSGSVGTVVPEGKMQEARTQLALASAKPGKNVVSIRKTS